MGNKVAVAVVCAAAASIGAIFRGGGRLAEVIGSTSHVVEDAAPLARNFGPEARIATTAGILNGVGRDGQEANAAIAAENLGQAKPAAPELPLKASTPHTAGFALPSPTPIQQAQAVLTAISKDATPEVVKTLTVHRLSLSYVYADQVMQQNFAASAEKIAKSNPTLKFEVFSGKMQIGRSITIRGVEISAGEINVYKVAGIAAGAAVACNGLSVDAFRSCVSKAIAKASNVLSNLGSVVVDKSPP
jgi:hypothetical protein